MELIILIVLLVNFAWLITRADKIINLLESIDASLKAKKEKK
jgi:hypothetical protein